MKQRSLLAVSIGLALAMNAGASLAQSTTPTPPAAKPAAQAPAKNAKADAAAQKAAADRAATQGVKPAATLPSTAVEDRRYKSCHDKDSDA